MNRSLPTPPQPPPQNAVGHERAALCGRMARLLHHALTGLDWPGLRFADRSRLDRALAQLESDIALARTVAGHNGRQAGGVSKRAGTTHSGTPITGTAKAAPSGEA